MRCEPIGAAKGFATSPRKSNGKSLLVDLLHALQNARRRSRSQHVGRQPKPDVLVAVLLAQIVGQLLQTLFDFIMQVIVIQCVMAYTLYCDHLSIIMLHSAVGTWNVAS